MAPRLTNRGTRKIKKHSSLVCCLLHFFQSSTHQCEHPIANKIQYTVGTALRLSKNYWNKLELTTTLAQFAVTEPFFKVLHINKNILQQSCHNVLWVLDLRTLIGTCKHEKCSSLVCHLLHFFNFLLINKNILQQTFEYGSQTQ